MSDSFLTAASSRAADGLDLTGLSLSSSSAADAALIPFYTYCRVRSEYFEGSGNGMACAQDVASGEILLSVPLDYCWTAAAARANPALAALGDGPLDAISPENLIALHLLIIKASPEPPATAAAADRCRWHHVKLIASTPIETLWDWSDAELKQNFQGSKWALAPSWSKADTLADLEEWSQYPPLLELFKAYEIHKLSYLWAHKVLNSRMTSFKRAKDGSILQLIAPGQDLFNHSADAPVSNEDVQIDDDKSLVVVRANRSYKQGEQATFHYSGTSNGRLLFSGGFVLATNPWDSVELALTLPLHQSAGPLFAELASTLDSGVKHGGAFAEALPAEFIEMAQTEDGSDPTDFVVHMRLMLSTLPEQLMRVLRFYIAAEHYSSYSTQITMAEIDMLAGTKAVAIQKLRNGLLSMSSGYPVVRAANEAELRTMEGEAAAGKFHPPAAEHDDDFDRNDPKWERAHRRRRHALLVVIGEQRIWEAGLAMLDRELSLLMTAGAGAA